MGIRWNHVGAIEFEGTFYQGFNNQPSFDGVPVGFTPSGVAIDVQIYYPKMTMAGLSFAIPTRLLTVKGEAAQFNSSDSRADEYALYVMQLERQAGEWFFVGGYAGEAITKRGTRAATFAPDRGLSQTFLGRAGYTIDTYRSVAVETAIRQNGDGAWVNAELTQTIGQHFRLTWNVGLIRGEPGDFLGQYRKNSHAVMVVRYSF